MFLHLSPGSFGMFWFIRAVCFYGTQHVSWSICMFWACGSLYVDPIKPSTPQLSVCACVSARCFYATLSEAPSGLDNTSPLLLSVSHSFHPPAEGEKKQKPETGVDGGGAVEITGCCLRRGSEKKKEQGVRKGGRGKVFAECISYNTGNVTCVA